jgi:hypothetical protein
MHVLYGGYWIDREDELGRRLELAGKAKAREGESEAEMEMEMAQRRRRRRR